MDDACKDYVDAHYEKYEPLSLSTMCAKTVRGKKRLFDWEAVKRLLPGWLWAAEFANIY